jgi:hypothetical protein
VASSVARRKVSRGREKKPEREIQVLISDERPYFALLESCVISLLISIPELAPFTLPTDIHTHLDI